MGIPRVLNMYEDYPFWFTFFTHLGYEVVLSDQSTKELFQKAMDTIPSDSACYPAKLVHGHIENLLEKKVDRIFYPCIQHGPSEGSKDNNFNCPMVMSYPEVIKHNMDETSGNYTDPFYQSVPTFARQKTNYNQTVRGTKNLGGLSGHDIKKAAHAAWDEEEKFKSDYYELTKKTVEKLEKDGDRAIVLSGRPYHLDPEINHGIPELINSLGLAVLTEDGVAPLGSAPDSLRVVDQWSYHSRLYRAAQYVAEHKNLELVELNSFGCGLDSIVADQVQEILANANKIHTLLKIDEGSNLGAIRIRLRSLLFVMNHRKTTRVEHSKPYSYHKAVFYKGRQENAYHLGPRNDTYSFPSLQSSLCTRRLQDGALAPPGARSYRHGTFLHS